MHQSSIWFLSWGRGEGGGKQHGRRTTHTTSLTTSHGNEKGEKRPRRVWERETHDATQYGRKSFALLSWHAHSKPLVDRSWPFYRADPSDSERYPRRQVLWQLPMNLFIKNRFQAREAKRERERAWGSSQRESWPNKWRPTSHDP